MTFESEPLPVQQPNDEPLLPEKPRTWTPAFRFLVVFVALIGLAATLYSVAGRILGNIPYPSSETPERYVLTGEQAAFILNCVFFVVCVAGLWFTKSALLRIGLILQAVALLGAMLQTFPVAAIVFVGFQSWPISFYYSLTFLYTPPYGELFQLTLGILAFLSLLCFSYRLARWQRSDKVFIWVQIAATLGLGIVILQASSFNYLGISWAYILEIAGGTFLGIAALSCFLLRPACWKANPLIVLCFTVGSVVSLLFDEVIQRFIHEPGSETQIVQISFAISLVGSTLVLLGLLLLIQRARGQKKASLRRPWPIWAQMLDFLRQLGYTPGKRFCSCMSEARCTLTV